MCVRVCVRACVSVRVYVCVLFQNNNISDHLVYVCLFGSAN